MNINKFWAVSLVLGLGWLVSPVQADGGPFSLGVRAVDYVPTDGHGDWNGGVQARLRLPLFFAAEGSVDKRRQDFGATTAKDYPVQLSLLAYFLPKIVVVQPFVLIGGGWYNTEVDGPAGYHNTQDRFGPHVGAGLDFHLNDHIYLDATYRFVYLDDLDSVDTAGNPRTIEDRGHQITAGVNYRF